MEKVGRSFSEPFTPLNTNICKSDNGSASFPIDDPQIRGSAAAMPYVVAEKATQKGTAYDVTALLAAVGGEQIQYIEFNTERRELETRQRWPLLRIVSGLLDQPERPVNVLKPALLHKDGVAI